MRVSEQILWFLGVGKKKPELAEVDVDRLKERLPAGRRAVRRAMVRLVQKGWVGKGKLTQAGEERVKELWPHWVKADWDGKWRVVVFDIPEKYRGLRAVVRRFLVSVGCSKVQRSLWVTPFRVAREIRAFFEGSKLSEMMLLVEAERWWPEVDVAKAWQLDRVKEKYKTSTIKAILSDPWLPEALLDKEFIATRKQAIEQWLSGGNG